MYHPFARLAPTTHGAKFENNKGCASMIPELSQYELRQMAEYDRQRAEEDRKLGRRRGQGMSSWFSSGRSSPGCVVERPIFTLDWHF
jgi:hypothetical protein